MKMRRRLVSCLLVLAFLLQPFTFTFSPVSRVFAQDAELQVQTQIKEVREDFKEAKDQVDEIEPVELGFWRKAALGLGWMFSGERKSTVVTQGTYHGAYGQGRSAEEAQKNKEWNDANNYVARIEEANEKIEESQKYFGDMDKSINNDDITSLLDVRELQNMLDQALAAQAEYQDSITQAGEDLVEVASSLSKASTALSLAATALTAAALITGLTVVGLPAVPAIEALAAACGKASLALSITSGKLDAIGNALIESAKQGITSDKEFGQLAANKVGKSFVSDGVSYGAGKLIGAGLDKYVTPSLKSWNTSRPLGQQFDSNQMDLLDWMARKTIKDTIAPAKSAAVGAATDGTMKGFSWLNDVSSKVNQNRQVPKYSPIPTPSSQPQLKLDGPFGGAAPFPY